mmetsp:Transcript_30555/g.79154  ORF Transcript_30555/g.79154 Transcript_30555/m.79154 type:complete len:227 (-) Transcript_30555:228-908(-)
MSCSGSRIARHTTRPRKNGTFRRRSWQETTSGTEEDDQAQVLLERLIRVSRSPASILDLCRELKRSRTSQGCRRITSPTCTTCTRRMAWRAPRRTGRSPRGPGRGTAVQERAERTPRGARAPQAEKVERSRTRAGISQARMGHSRRTQTTKWTPRRRCSRRPEDWFPVDPVCACMFYPLWAGFPTVCVRVCHRCWRCEGWGSPRLSGPGFPISSGIRALVVFRVPS